MLGKNTRELSSTDVLEALLEVDPELGCCPDVFRSLRHRPAIRRAIAQERIAPVIRWYDVMVDYDDQAHRQLNPQQHDFIHQALQPGHFVIRRAGQHVIRLAEIIAGYSLSVACQARLIDALRLERTCFAEARSALDSVLRDVGRPIMAHCGPLFTFVGARDQVLPSVQQFEGRRLLNAIRLADRYSQDYAILAVARV